MPTESAGSKDASGKPAISGDTKVTIGAAVAAAIAFIAWSNNDQRWKTNIDRDVSEIRSQIAQIRVEMEKATSSRWTKNMMSTWVLKAEAATGMKLPDPREIPFNID